MWLLIKKNCPFCEEIEEIHKNYPEIKKFYVENGFILMEENKLPLDQRIKGLPALITNQAVYIGKTYVLNFFKNYKNNE